MSSSGSDERKDDMSNDANRPMDATAMQAEAVVKAAIEWRYEHRGERDMSRVEWELWQATNGYGDTWKGLRAR